MMNSPLEHWYQQPKNEVHEAVFRFVRRTEEEQGDVFDRLAMLESLYDPYSPTGDDSTESSQKLANVSENLVASNVDTVYASIANAEIRARFLTDGADWSVQRRAKKMEYYSEGLGKQVGLQRKCKIAYKEAPKKGMGLVKVYADRWDEPTVEVAAIEDIVVPDCDSRVGELPRQLHHVQRNYDRDYLRAEYPEHAELIDASYSTRMRMLGTGTTHNKIAVIESIRLPIGKRGEKARKAIKGKGAKWIAKGRYVPGRRTITIENGTLLDEEYHDPFYPFAMGTWSERQGSFYPISGAERIMGIQRTLNKRNWQIERVLDQNALLTTYVRPSDGNLTVKTTKAGNIAVIRGDYPQTPNPPLVNAETYQSRRDLKDSAPEQMGVSQFATQSRIPAGLETGAAVREYSAQSTMRHSPQEAGYEQMVLDAYFLLMHVCKQLGDRAPAVLVTRWRKAVEWKEVDMGQVKIQLSAASTLPRTAAGRQQTVIEWAQAGVISSDSAKRLIEHPDLERELSLYTSAIESIEEQIEVIFDGGIATPEPQDNLNMIVWRATGSFHNARTAGAPEDVLEALRDYIAYAGFMIDQMNQQAAMAGPPPGMGGNPPGPGRPEPAFSSQAMQLNAD